MTHLLIAENEEKKGKFLLGSWGGIRLGEKHASTPVGGSDGLSIKEMNDALKLKRATKSSDTDESEGDAVKAARARRRASKGSERGEDRVREKGQKRERERERDMHSSDPSSLAPPVSQSICIAVQQVLLHPSYSSLLFPFRKSALFSVILFKVINLILI